MKLIYVRCRYERIQPLGLIYLINLNSKPKEYILFYVFNTIANITLRLISIILILFTSSSFGQTLTSTITSVNGGFTLTCLKSSLTLTVTANTTNSYQSQWYASQSTSFAGNSVVISNPDTYTIVTKDLVSNDSVVNTLTIYQDTLKPQVKRDTVYFHCGSVPGSQYDYTTSITVNFLMPCPTCTYSWVNHIGGILTPTNVATVLVEYLGSYTCNVTNTVNGCSSIFIMDVLCNVGINEYENSTNAICFYPNPVIDKLNYSKVIDFSIDRIVITNNLGQNAVEVNHPELREELDLSVLPPGIYFISLEFNSHKRTYKFIKQ